MLHRASSSIIRLKWIITIVVLTTLSTTLLTLTSSSRGVYAQETASNMRTLLTHLDEEEVSILFQFAVPLVAEQTDWIIPNGLDGQDDDISINISEIGDDYICFDELAGQAYSNRCTPFSNIVSISYLNMPQ